MLFWLASIALSAFTSFMLLQKPYLRETSIGWLLAIWATPFIGSLIFLTMVVRKKDKHHHHNEHQSENNDYQNDLEYSKKIIEKIGVKNGFQTYSNLDDSMVLRDDEFLEELLTQVEQAKKSIWICTYILSGDAKEALLTRLYDAHERGVKIYLLVDRIGSGFLLSPKKIKEYLSQPYNSVIFRKSLMQSLLYVEKRLHSKIVIIDKELALVGSHNIRDEIKHDAKGFARNISLLVTGSVVSQFEMAFSEIYEEATGEVIYQEIKAKKEYQTKLSCPARVTYSDPIAQDFKYNDYLNSLFFSAQKRMYIWMPYMIPSDILRTSIINAHKTGVKVKVLIPIKTDSKLVDNAHQLVLNELTDHGVPCAASTGAFDHTKIIIIDDISVVGSTNLDHRSLFRNYEANIEINDRSFTGRVSELFEEEFEKAKTIDCTHPTKKRTIINQITSLIATLY